MLLASDFDLHAMPTELPPLVTLGNPRLSQPSMPVAVNQIVNDDFQSRLRTLRLGLEHHGANGIAAPQLGWFERYLLMRDPSHGSAQRGSCVVLGRMSLGAWN